MSSSSTPAPAIEAATKARQLQLQQREFFANDPSVYTAEENVILEEMSESFVDASPEMHGTNNVVLEPVYVHHREDNNNNNEPSSAVCEGSHQLRGRSGVGMGGVGGCLNNIFINNNYVPPLDYTTVKLYFALSE
jgi:hypothetical protein